MDSFVDLPLGLRIVRRAEATVLERAAAGLAALEKSDAAELAWALSTVLIAAQQGQRLHPGVFALAESIAWSRNSKSV